MSTGQLWRIARSLTLRWLLASSIVALAGEWPFLWFVYGFLEPNAFAPAWMVAFAAISWALPALLFAVLTAPIFKLKLPAFRGLHWIGLHVAVGLTLGMAASVIVGSCLGTNAAQGLRSSVSWLLDTDVLSYATTDRLSFRKLFIIGGVPMIASPIVAVIAGAIIGSMQTLVLRGAACGLVDWIVLSAVAAASASIVGTLHPLENFIELLKLIDPETARNGYAPNDAYHNMLDLIFTTIGSLLLVLPTIVTASIMLVAVHRLRPR
jgi:hypothetical protein